MSLLGVLLIVFVILKLVGTIDWSWFWVLSPLYPSILITLVAASVVVFGAAGKR